MNLLRTIFLVLRKWVILPVVGTLCIATTMYLVLHERSLSVADGALMALGFIIAATPFLPPLRVGYSKDGWSVEKLAEQVASLQSDVAGEKANVAGLIRRSAEANVMRATEYAGDPLKGEFGSLSERNGLRLDASVEQIKGTELARVRMTVRSISPGVRLQGAVVFHLHPTFAPQDKPSVPVSPSGSAELEVTSFGAFTVGAEANGTRLELDLMDAPGAFEPWRSR